MAKRKEGKPRWLINRERNDKLSQFQPEPQANTLDSLVAATPAPAYAANDNFNDSSRTGLYQATTTGAGSGGGGTIAAPPARKPKFPRWLVNAYLAVAALSVIGTGVNAYFNAPSVRSYVDAQWQRAQDWLSGGRAAPQAEPTVTAGNGNFTAPITDSAPAGIETLMSQEQVKATWEELLGDNLKLLTSNDYELLGRAEKANKSMYYFLTGRTFEQDKFVTKILPQEEYNAVAHPALKDTAGSTGFGADGTVFIYASLPAPAGSLITTLASETGNAYYEQVGPKNIDVGITDVDFEFGLRYGETLAALYRGATVNKMREFGMMGLTPDPQIDTIRRLPELLSRDYFFTEAWGAAWVLALEDPEAKANLEATGWAGSKPMTRLFERYALLDFKQYPKEVNIARREAFNQKVEFALANKQAYEPLIRAALEKRVAADGQKYVLGVSNTLP